MSEQNIHEDQSGGERNFLTRHWKKVVIIAAFFLAVGGLIWVVVYLVSNVEKFSWFSNKMIALYIAAGVIVAVVAGGFFLRKTLRTRLRMEKTLQEDPDINDW